MGSKTKSSFLCSKKWKVLITCSECDFHLKGSARINLVSTSNDGAAESNEPYSEYRNYDTRYHFSSLVTKFSSIDRDSYAATYSDGEFSYHSSTDDCKLLVNITIVSRIDWPL
ncbi:unnamed protein product [Albugo candida]|uniref:Uncharacterized protein n=1 Tax=Albugo candida TaxID=65357 RepID=A0A024GHE0_9STRA|nr:unnamed protein product [Albugo candida]|eukprot:CCI45767.1 unnamed protein product [Albugo candida]